MYDGACLGHRLCLGCSRCAFRCLAHTHCDYRVRVAMPGLVLMPILLPLLEVHLLAMRVHICIRVESLRAMRACVQHLARVRGHVFLSLRNIRAYLHNDYFCIYVRMFCATYAQLVGPLEGLLAHGTLVRTCRVVGVLDVMLMRLQTGRHFKAIFALHGLKVLGGVHHLNVSRKTVLCRQRRVTQMTFDSLLRSPRVLLHVARQGLATSYRFATDIANLVELA